MKRRGIPFVVGACIIFMLYTVIDRFLFDLPGWTIFPVIILQLACIVTGIIVGRRERKKSQYKDENH